MYKKIASILMLFFAMFFTAFGVVKAEETWMSDLTIKDISFYPKNPVKGEKFTGQVKVKLSNIGNKAVQVGPTECLYQNALKIQSATPAIDWLGTDRANVNISSCGPTTSGDIEITYDFQEIVFYSDVNLIAVADLDNNIKESNESNNAFEKTVTLSTDRQSKPDLTVKDVKILQGGVGYKDLGRNIVVGEVFYFNPVYANTTQKSAGQFTIDGYVDGEYNARVYINGISANASDATINAFLATVKKVGQHIIKIVIDPDNSIDESDESNNIFEKTITVSNSTITSNTMIITPLSDTSINLKWFTSYSGNVVLLYKNNELISATAKCQVNNNSVTNSYLNAGRECELVLLDLIPGGKYSYKIKEGENYSIDYSSYFIVPIKFNQVEVVEISKSSAKIVWTSERDQISRVLYYPKTRVDEQKEIGNYDFVKSHSLTMLNLKPATTYIYMVISTDQEGGGTVSDMLEFTTLKDENFEYANNANRLTNNKLDEILVEIKQLRNLVKEQENKIKYLEKLTNKVQKLTDKMEDALNQFITYGVDANTQKLGAGERAAVISSYQSAFTKLPETEAELADAIKIANGRWPSATSTRAEKRAKEQFQKIYKRIPDMNNAQDNAAVTVMAYGLRQKAENRNMESEKQGIKTFKNIYGKNPSTTDEWNTMQAITYSGASRGVDSDGDLLTDTREKELGTNPKNKDTDGDGHLDGIEVANGYNPLKK